mgnify:CR=1 FL=1
MTEMLRTLLCGALLITAIPALADDAPVSRVPRISDHPSDPVLKQLFDDTRARGGQIIMVSNAEAEKAGCKLMAHIPMPSVHPFTAPLIYAVPMQLMAYHTAVLMGTDVDQPRNLAKSVTVE